MVETDGNLGEAVPAFAQVLRASDLENRFAERWRETARPTMVADSGRASDGVPESEQLLVVASELELDLDLVHELMEGLQEREDTFRASIELLRWCGEQEFPELDEYRRTYAWSKLRQIRSVYGSGSPREWPANALSEVDIIALVADGRYLSRATGDDPDWPTLIAARKREQLLLLDEIAQRRRETSRSTVVADSGRASDGVPESEQLLVVASELELDVDLVHELMEGLHKREESIRASIELLRQCGKYEFSELDSYQPSYGWSRFRQIRSVHGGGPPTEGPASALSRPDIVALIEHGKRISRARLDGPALSDLIEVNQCEQLLIVAGELELDWDLLQALLDAIQERDKKTFGDAIELLRFYGDERRPDLGGSPRTLRWSSSRLIRTVESGEPLGRGSGRYLTDPDIEMLIADGKQLSRETVEGPEQSDPTTTNQADISTQSLPLIPSWALARPARTDGPLQPQDRS